MDVIDSYDIQGPTILHQEPVIDLICEGIRIAPDESKGFQRNCCGGMMEKSSSTIEVPDIDINARFHLDSQWIKVCPTNQSFLFEIEVQGDHKHKIDEITHLMQYHGNKTEEVQDASLSAEAEKSIAKSYVKTAGKLFLSSHVARWQLVGVIKEMQDMGLEVDQASRMASEVGLSNGVYNVMIYDTMVCRRGTLRRAAFEKLLEKYISETNASGDEKEDLSKIKDLLLCFFPPTGIQIDYTAGFHISEDAVPKEATKWLERKGDWPSERLKKEVLAEGALLVPKTFKDGTKEEKSKRWRLNFDLNMLMRDQFYSRNIDTRRILIILKDIKNMYMRSSLVKSYYLKLAIAWTMYEKQDQRKTMTNKDLLVYSLEFLREAFDKMKLKDFFNEKFNHLHRNKDRGYEATGIAKRIEKLSTE